MRSKSTYTHDPDEDVFDALPANKMAILRFGGFKQGLFYKLCFLIFGFFLFTSASEAQTRACWGTSCGASDVTLHKIYLASDVTGTPLTSSTCSTPGATVNVYLAIVIENTNNSDRNGVFLSGNISSGNTSTPFAHCFGGNLPPDTKVTLVDPTPFEWNCGAPLIMTDAFTGWGSASGNVCTGNPADCGAAAFGKCRTYPDLTIVTPLVANFTSASSCPGGTEFQTIQFTNTTSGGTTPYSYKWESSTDGSTWSTFSTAASPAFTPNNSNQYYIKLTVTDATTPTANVDVEQKSGITAGVCCTNPVITNQTPAAICSGSSLSLAAADFTGSNTIPAGTTFTWSAPSAAGISGLGSGTDETSFSTGNLTNSTNADIAVVYTITPESGSCTGNSFTITVTVRADLTASISAGTTVCYNTGTNITITGTPNAVVTYTYSPGGSNTEVTLNGSGEATVATGNLTANRTYSLVSVKYANAPICSETIGDQSATVTVQAAPNAGTDGTLTICAGSTVTAAQLFARLGGSPDAGGSWSPALAGAGTYTYTVDATAPCTVDATAQVVVTAQAAPNAGTDGTLTICAGSTVTAAQLFAQLGGTPDAGGSWSPALAGAGTYTYTVDATAPCTVDATAQVVVSETPNVICGDYTGDVFANVTSSSAGTATVNLQFTITGDQSATCNSTVGLTASDFSIIKSSATPNNTGVSIGQITYANGVVSAVATITLPSNTYSATVEFTLQENDPDFVLGSCTEVALVTVSTIVDGFVTGGGYLLQDGNTIGPRGGAPNNGYKNNFGFNIKYNKAGNKYQGNWNTLFRRNEGGVVHTYQVKSAQASTLTITRLSETSYKAEFTFTGGNMKDLTNNSQTIASGLTINVVVYDNGEPGGGVDQMYYEVKSGSTILYATAGSNALRDLTKGNIQIHVAKTKSAARLSAASDEVDVTATPLSFELKVLPNPSTTYFTLQLKSDNTRDKMQLRILDASGRAIENRQNLAPNQTQQVGAAYRPGMYFAELFQGNKKQVVKLIKL